MQKNITKKLLEAGLRISDFLNSIEFLKSFLKKTSTHPLTPDTGIQIKTVVITFLQMLYYHIGLL